MRGVRAQAAPASATTAEPTKVSCLLACLPACCRWELRCGETDLDVLALALSLCRLIDHPLPPPAGGRAVSNLVRSSELVQLKTGSWQWKYGEETLKIYYEEHVKSGGGGGGGAGPVRDLLFLPSIADVSYTGEWSPVARLLVGADGGSWRAVVVDWPGLGYSDRPALDYSYQIMEQFLKDFVTAPDGPLASCAGGWVASISVQPGQVGSVLANLFLILVPTQLASLFVVFQMQLVGCLDGWMDSIFSLGCP